jgi:hypothetical protein
VNYRHLILISVALAKRALLSPRVTAAQRLRALEFFEEWVTAGFLTREQLQLVDALSDTGVEMIDAARELDPKPWPGDNFSVPPSLHVLSGSFEYLAKVSPTLKLAAELGERRDVAELH